VPDSISYKEVVFDVPLLRVDSIFASNIDTTESTTPTNLHPIDTSNHTAPIKHPTHPVDTSSAPIALNNLFFDFNKATLQPESMPELGNLIRFLKQNATIKIEIAGHTDSVGTADFNQHLSQARAESVKTYLVQHGIAASRLRAKGYGLTQPIADNATEEGRKKNRRTEFRILKS
jgi:outer membrane protein OmpA-like peptidoglycan-associated protein